jgi:hypothetical protein
LSRRISIKKEPRHVGPDAFDTFELSEAATGELDEEMLFVAGATLGERVDHAAQEH